MLETVLAGLFDYAGMFPPAALTFEEALHASARFRDELHRPDMVANDMVVTLDDLPKLTPEALAAAGFEGPCRVCVVGVGPERADEAVDTVCTVQSVGSQVRISSLEIASPDPTSAPWATWRDALQSAHVRLYAEPKWNDAQWQEGLSDIWDVLARLKESGPAVGLKFRCAGPTAVSQATLADILAGANRVELPLKATQGLHHPILEPELGNDHGFLNVLVALRLQHALELPPESLHAILATNEIADFTFDGLGWGTHRVMAQRVMEAAAAVPFSIGSCSLHEPDADLKRLLG